MSNSTAQTRKGIYLYLLFTFSISTIFYTLLIHSGKLRGASGIYSIGLMWSPAVATLLTCTILKKDFTGLAWQWGKTRYQFWAWLTPLLYALFAYLFIWITGLGGFFNKEFIDQTTTSLGWSKLPYPILILLYFIILGIYRLPGSMSNALGEEIGWRGFLAPELYKLTNNYTRTSLISGGIWAIWHYPVLIFADYNNGAPAWYGLTCFTVMVVSMSFTFTWFRLKSNSLWTGVLLHASHNLFIQGFFTPITKDTGNSKYYIDEFGAVLAIVSVLLAIYFWRRRHELPQPDQLTLTLTTTHE
jgi:membrane protease YdiL (CAAX protease family)